MGLNAKETIDRITGLGRYVKLNFIGRVRYNSNDNVMRRDRRKMIARSVARRARGEQRDPELGRAFGPMVDEYGRPYMMVRTTDEDSITLYGTDNPNVYVEAGVVEGYWWVFPATAQEYVASTLNQNESP